MKAAFSFIYKYKFEKGSYTGAGGDLDDIDYMRKQSFEKNIYALRMTLHLMPQVTYVGRVDYRHTDVDTGTLSNPIITSAKIRTTMFSQVLTWSPTNWIYVQGTLNNVSDKLKTPAAFLTSSATVVLSGIIPPSSNNYWNGGITVGWLLDKNAEFTASYNHNSVDNWFDNSVLTVPYGASYKDDLFRLTGSLRVSENTRVIGEYGYAKTVDRASRGANNYNATMLSAKLQYRF
jgi:hypothetical protein